MSQRHSAPLGAAHPVLAQSATERGLLADATDAELCAVVGSGLDRDGSAIGELYRRHSPLALGYARKLSGSSALSDDLVAEAFLKSWRRLAGGHLAGPFQAYLLSAVRNGYIDTLRRGARLVSVEVADGAVVDAAAQTAAHAGDPSRAIADTDLLRSLFEGLAPRHRDVMWLHAVEGWSAGEIGEHLGVRPNTVSVLIHRVRRALRAAYAEHEAHLLAA